MDFQALYEKMLRRSTDALCSMWANGEPDFQKYIKYLLEKEEIIAVDPVFQATFPWESADVELNNLTNLFSKEFIDSLDKADITYRFPKNRKPYIHQLTSWESLLVKKHSIVVTSGTGSGKTECFMIPVLADLFEQANNGIREGVGALFLYPLNALMGSQKNRILAWTKALNSKVRFGIYNGKTPEVVRVKDNNSQPCEALDRQTIRQHPPQVLFTNPTMLEYMLVRKKDQSLLEKSHGKLRWIILDEAHTYSGSSATEIALLIRRVLDAFGVKETDVRFAATSATIGNGKDSDTSLRRFFSELTGQKEELIDIIGGNRFIPILPPIQKSVSDLSELSALSFKEKIVCKEVQSIQKLAIEQPVLTLEEIGRPFDCKTTEERLKVVNILSEKGDDTILPLRAHFFMRAIPGLYACTNINCKRHNELRLLTGIPSISSRTTPLCPEPDCEYPMFELAGCTSCGARLLEGEYNEEKKLIRLKSKEKLEVFEFEEQEDDETEDLPEVSASTGWKSFWLFPKSKVPEHNLSGFFPCGITENGKKESNGPYIEITDHNLRCPVCGNTLNKPQYFRASAEFLSRIILPTLLEEAPSADEIKDRMVWQGKKIIGFTDNRQGTARSAAAMNADVERTWVRTRVYHQLAKIRQSQLPQSELGEDERKQLEVYKQYPEVFKEQLKELEIRVKSISDPNLSPSPRISWYEMEDILLQHAELKFLNRSLTNRNNLGTANEKEYIRALLYDQFARRPRRVNSLETLGLVRLVYPELEKEHVPEFVKQVGINENEWRQFLKICIDYFIRENTFIHIDKNVQNLIMQHYETRRIYPSNYDYSSFQGRSRPRKWPTFYKNKQRQSRLTLLLFFGLNGKGTDKIDVEKEDTINKILDYAWRALLPLMEGKDERGYNFNLSRYAYFELVTEAKVCPITHRFLDCDFKGLTPVIKGNLNTIDIDKYRVKSDRFKVPYFPFPDGRTAKGETVKQREITDWASNAFLQHNKAGLWSDIYEKLFIDYPVFLSGEHSAQQSDSRLRYLEKEFEDGRLNVLSCSTTMEMGVDIGGVSTVIMNNVPPKTANYLQRAGRAGRRSEPRSMALTFCKANPIGEEVLNDPKITMTRNVTIPKISFTSKHIIQRHINSCLLGNFIRTRHGMNINEKVEDFFYGHQNEDSICDIFTTWLAENIQNNDIFLKVQRICERTSLSSHAMSGLIAIAQDAIIKVRNELRLKRERINNNIEKLKKEENYTDNSPAIKALKYEERHLLSDSSLKYLVEQGFLPSAGIPTGVVEFNINNIDDIKKMKQEHDDNKGEDNTFRREDLPTHHVSRALTEYAPGKPVVLDGWVYHSAGIALKSTFKESEIFKIRICTNCGHQQLLSGDMSQPCPACGRNNFSGINEIGGAFTEFIEPAGYAVDIYKTPDRCLDTPPSYSWVEPLLLNMEPWAEDSMAMVDMRLGGEHSKIIYYNIGHGNGYAVCTECGRTEPMPLDVNAIPLENHLRLRGGKDTGDKLCRGNDNNIKIRSDVALAGSFHTDVIEIRLRDIAGSFSNDESLMLSFAVALKWQLCKHLGIDDDEIGLGIKKYRTDKHQHFRSLFLYDTANGGAGYIKQIPDYYDILIEKMHKRICECDCNSCCTKCLLDRSSQSYVNLLNRKNLIEWLEKTEVSCNQIIEPVKHLPFQLTVEQLPLTQALLRRTVNSVPKEIKLFLSGAMKEWDLQNWNISKELRRLENLGTLITFVIPSWESMGDPGTDLFIYSSIKSFANIVVGTGTSEKLSNVTILAQLFYGDNNTQTWFTKDISLLPPPNKDFDQRLPKDIIRCIGEYQLDTFEPVPQPVLSQNMVQADSKYRATTMPFSNFGSFCITIWNNSLPELQKVLQNKDVTIFYSDSYLNTPLGAMLFAELLKFLKQNWNVQFTSVDLNLCSLKRQFNSHDNMVFRNWYKEDQRSKFLINALHNNGINNVAVVEQPPEKMEHFRYFEIETDTHCVTIRPDGGIAHGWMVTPGKVFPFNGVVDEQILVYKEMFKLSNLAPQKNTTLLTTIIVEKLN